MIKSYSAGIGEFVEKEVVKIGSQTKGAAASGSGCRKASFIMGRSRIF